MFTLATGRLLRVILRPTKRETSKVEGRESTLSDNRIKVVRRWVPRCLRCFARVQGKIFVALSFSFPLVSKYVLRFLHCDTVQISAKVTKVTESGLEVPAYVVLE